jgi:hypothetical protein
VHGHYLSQELVVGVYQQAKGGFVCLSTWSVGQLVNLSVSLSVNLRVSCCTPSRVRPLSVLGSNPALSLLQPPTPYRTTSPSNRSSTIPTQSPTPVYLDLEVLNPTVTGNASIITVSLSQKGKWRLLASRARSFPTRADTL